MIYKYFYSILSGLPPPIIPPTILLVAINKGRFLGGEKSARRAYVLHSKPPTHLHIVKKSLLLSFTEHVLNLLNLMGWWLGGGENRYIYKALPPLSHMVEFKEQAKFTGLDNAPIIEQKPSIKLIKNSRGYGWEIRNPSLDVEAIKKVNDKLVEEYGEQND